MTIETLRVIRVNREIIKQDDGSTLVFRDPENQLHIVDALPPTLQDVREDTGWRVVLAVQERIRGRAVAIYRAATAEEVGGLFWN